LTYKEDGLVGDVLTGAASIRAHIRTYIQRRPAISGRLLALYALEFGLLAASLMLAHMLTIYVWRLPNGDVKLYHDYALAFWTQPPFLHQLPKEYPPLAILPFTLTLLPPIGDYMALYAYWMGALVLVGYLGFLRYSTRRRAIVYAVYLIVGATATLLARFDLVPALLTLAALWATQRRRFGYAYVLIAAGVLLKLYPIFLLPLVMIAQARAATARARIEGRLPAKAGETADGAGASAKRTAGQVVGKSGKQAGTTWRSLWPVGHIGGVKGFRGFRGMRPRAALHALLDDLLAHPATARVAQGGGLCLGLIAFGFWCALAVNPAGALSGFSYASDRPLQVESTPASLLWLGTLVGIPAHPDYSFVSLNYVGPLDALLKPLSALALVGACGLVYWRQARGRLTTGQAFVACLCAVLVTNKIFSPQYLIWVLPIVAAVEGFDVVWLAVCVLTTIDFPIIYQMRHPIWTVTYTPAFMLVLTVRNLLLIYITVRAIIRPRRARRRGGLSWGLGTARLDTALQAATASAGTAIQPTPQHAIQHATEHVPDALSHEATDARETHEGARPAVLG
jgi:hypothetical protein